MTQPVKAKLKIPFADLEELIVSSALIQISKLGPDPLPWFILWSQGFTSDYMKTHIASLEEDGIVPIWDNEPDHDSKLWLKFCKACGLKG